MEDKATIRDYLERKDQDMESHVPKSFQYLAAHKKEHLFMEEQVARYESRTAASCIPHCFKILESPVVTQVEADCLTNCAAKANEVLVHANTLNARLNNYAL